jgi:hypothetical protein
MSTSLSVLPSVRMEQVGYLWTDFHEDLYADIFRKTCREDSSFIKIQQEKQLFYMKTNIHF